MTCIARLSAAVLCTLLAGCAGGGHGDEGDGGDERAEAQARQLAAPHEKQARECEAEGKLRDAVKRYVAAIQALPEGNTTAKDFELREKVIQLVVSLDPPPAISEDVQQMLNRAEATAAQAKDEAGWRAAAAEYERALRYAPWEAKGNYNLGLMYELVKKEELAVRFLKLYLRASPVAGDADNVRKKVAELEARAKRRGIGALAGIWRYQTSRRDRGQGGKEYKQDHWLKCHFRIDLKGSEIVVTRVAEEDIDVGQGDFQQLKDEGVEWARMSLKGRSLQGSRLVWRSKDPFGNLWGVVAEDFEGFTVYWRIEDAGAEGGSALDEHTFRKQN